jgi:hypothetical protein
MFLDLLKQQKTDIVKNNGKMPLGSFISNVGLFPAAVL